MVPTVQMLVILDQRDGRFGGIINPSVFFDGNWLTAVLKTVLQAESCQGCTGFWIKPQPLQHNLYDQTISVDTHQG